MSWINTYKGIRFDVLNPRVEDFDLEDQAHALAFTARYNGHTKHFYSVAAHSIVMSHIIEDRYKHVYNDDTVKDLAKCALIHDNQEAYIGDIVQPLKQTPAFTWFRELELRYETLIAEWLGLTSVFTVVKQQIVAALDREMCAYESEVLFDTRHPDWKLPEKRADEETQGAIRFQILSLVDDPLLAKYAYLERFAELFGREVMNDLIR